jgi:hypothetical protein
VGKVQLTGLTSNDQDFDANPQRIWRVTESSAVVDGHDLGIARAAGRAGAHGGLLFRNVASSQ